MTFGYVQPFSFTIAPTPAVGVASVRHGVTEITLSDGRLVRATLHVKERRPPAGHAVKNESFYGLGGCGIRLQTDRAT